MAKHIKRPASPELQRLRKHVAQLFATKRYDLAEGVVRQILAIEPNDASGLRNLSICMFMFRRYDDAIALARAAVSADPTPQNLCLLADLHMAKDEFDQSLDLFQQAVALQPEYVRSLSGMVCIYVLKGMFSEALQWSERGLAIGPDDVGMLRNRAKALAGLSREPEAIEVMEHFLRIAPDTAASHAAARDILKRLGRIEEASQFALRAMQMKPSDPHLHNSLAQLKLQERKFDDAQRHFESAAEIYDARKDGQKGSKVIEIQALMGQAAINMNNRQFQLAEAQYARVLESNPTHAGACTMLAGSIAAQKRFDEALPLARKAADQYPDNLHCQVVLASLLSDVEQCDEAMLVARRAAQIKPDSHLPHLVTAAIHLEMRDYSNAHAAAERALAILSEPAGHRALAVSLAGLGDREKAMLEIEKMLQKEPDSFSANAAAGFVCHLLGEFGLAESYLRRAAQFDPSGVECEGKLGVVYHAQGKIDEAIPLLERSHARNPYQRQVREALQAIRDVNKT
jgi:tetratricopeptide (TPR) repeat protein